MSKRTRLGMRVSTISRATKQGFESLERRVFLCGTPAEAIAAGVPATMFGDDGHMSMSDFKSLPKQLRSHIDMHMVRDPLSENPIDYDKLLGIPLHPDGPPTSTQGGGETVTDALPDFFPSLYNGFLIDQTSQSGRTLLKFGTQVNNQGDGPASLISGRPGIDPIPTGAPITSWVNPDGSQNVIQAVYAWNTSTNSFQLSYYRAGGRFTYHPGHQHFHYDGYAYYKLRQNNGGTPGAYIQRSDGTGVVGEKIGFCLLDFVGGTWQTLAPPNGPGGPNTSLPHYNAPGQPGNGCGLLQGVTVGHADGYSNSLEGQWIDVTGVPNGSYFVEISLDGDNAVLESREDNNTGNFAYNLNVNPPGGGISPDLYDQGTSHNDTFATAVDMNVLGTFTQTGLTIHWGQDADFFKFTASSSGSASITTAATNGDINLYLYDSNQTQIGAATTPSGSESLTYNFVKGQTYYVKTNCYNSTVSSNYQIAWNIKPEINASATVSVANEFGPVSGTISVGRNGPVTSPLTVNFTATGTATRGVDYDIYLNGSLISGSTFAIGNLASVADLEIRPNTDHVPEPTETVILTLNSSSAYVIGSGTSGTVNIGDSGPDVDQTTQIWQTSPHKLIYHILRGQAASVTLADFVIKNLDTNQNVTPQSFNVVDNGNGTATATVTFNGVLPDGHYRSTILAGSISNSQGDVNFADINYNFFTLTADANHDGFVNVNDFTILASNFGLTGRDASQGDFNYDGIVNVDDFTILATRFGTALGGTSRSGIATGPSALRGLFADGKGIDETQRQLLDLLA